MQGNLHSQAELIRIYMGTPRSPGLSLPADLQNEVERFKPVDVVPTLATYPVISEFVVDLAALT